MTATTHTIYDGNFSSKKVEVLGIPGIARRLQASTSSTNTTLSPTISRISMKAFGTDIRFSIGIGSQTANANSSHYIADGERLDFAVPEAANIAVISDTTVTGFLELTELT